MSIIVSFTSYPPRIATVHKVVESLYQQTMPADEIILYLSLDEFPKMESDLPDTLNRLNGQKGFRIEWVQGNLKSHKKYYYALQKYKDDVVITVDDDIMYAKTMISELFESRKRFPDAVSARRVRMLIKNGDRLDTYKKWEGEIYLDEYVNVPRMDLCAVGIGGICYPILNRDHWFDKETILKMADEQDDLWLKYNEIIDHIPVVYTKSSQKDIVIEESQINKLSSYNLYGRGNDKCIYDLSMLLKEQDEGAYRKWFQELMTWEEYIIEKKKFFSGVYNAMFDRVGSMPIYVYGAGIMAQSILMILADLGLIQRIEGIIVSDKLGNPSELYNLQIKELSEINQNMTLGVILGVRSENRKEVRDILKGYNCQYIELDLRIISRYYPIEWRYYKMMLLR